MAAPLWAVTPTVREWIYSEIRDDFDGSTVAIAMSPYTYGSPYRESYMLVRCSDGEQLDVYLSFEYINRTGDGPIAVKVDDTAPVQMGVTESEDRSALFLGIGNIAKADAFMEELAAADSFAVRFTYYKQGSATIKYSMDGAADALAKVAAACNLRARAEAKAAEDAAREAKNEAEERARQATTERWVQWFVDVRSAAETIEPLKGDFRRVANENGVPRNMKVTLYRIVAMSKKFSTNHSSYETCGSTLSDVARGLFNPEEDITLTTRRVAVPWRPGEYVRLGYLGSSVCDDRHPVSMAIAALTIPAQSQD